MSNEEKIEFLLKKSEKMLTKQLTNAF